MNNNSYVDFVTTTRPFGWEYMRDPQPHHFKFEELDIFWWQEMAVKYQYELPLIAVSLYITAIFSIKHWMRDRKAFVLKKPLFLWNLGLGVFSIVGFLRILPVMIFSLQQPNGFYDSICSRTNGTVAMSYWMILFVLSKFVELGDTMFIVLRKRDLVFLQWYHHAITLSVSWIVASYVEPINRWYAVLNYGVHSLMYPYFALRAIDVKIPLYVANTITFFQLVQMIAGLSVNIISYYYQLNGHDCYRHPTSITVFTWVYGSFLFLFGKLFYDTVIKQGRRKRLLAAKNKKLE